MININRGHYIVWKKLNKKRYCISGDKLLQAIDQYNYNISRSTDKRMVDDVVYDFYSKICYREYSILGIVKNIKKYNKCLNIIEIETSYNDKKEILNIYSKEKKLNINNLDSNLVEFIIKPKYSIFKGFYLKLIDMTVLK